MVDGLEQRVAAIDERLQMADSDLMQTSPGLYAIVSFTPDTRFTTVHFDGFRGRDLVVSLALPFLGWAVVVTWVKDGQHGTQLVAVGLDEHGDPVTAVDIARNYSLPEGQVIQTKLVVANGTDIAPFEPWPEGLRARQTE